MRDIPSIFLDGSPLEFIISVAMTIAFLAIYFAIAKLIYKRKNNGKDKQ